MTASGVSSRILHRFADFEEVRQRRCIGSWRDPGRAARSVAHDPPPCVLVDQPGALPLQSQHGALQRADRGPALATDPAVLITVARTRQPERRTKRRR